MAERTGARDAPGLCHAPALVSVVVPVFNGGDELDRCLEAILQSDWPAFECIVVDDASTDPRITDIVERRGVRSRRLEERSGPAVARNAGAEMARGGIVFFTDADVLLHPDALSKAMSALESDPGLAAVFGSYDDAPAEHSLLSRYRNLYHHWNHQIANPEASTFWTGCGAVRKDVFTELGGFNANFQRPSIEDIEFGYRMREAGHRVRLLKAMRCTHLKRWSFLDMMKTDVLRRGAPWVALLLRHRSVPMDLNLNPRAKIATLSAALWPAMVLLALTLGHPGALVPLLALLLAAGICSRFAGPGGSAKPRNSWQSRFALLTGSLMVLLALLWVRDPWALALLAPVAIVIWAQWDFYRLLSERGGYGFAIAVIPLQLLFFLGCAISVPLGWLQYLRQA